MDHPLKDPKSPHYQLWQGLEGIDVLEKALSRQERIAWAKGNILKYRLRIGKKGDPLRDLEKIQHYEAYLAYLEKD